MRTLGQMSDIERDVLRIDLQRTLTRLLEKHETNACVLAIVVSEDRTITCSDLTPEGMVAAAEDFVRIIRSQL